MPTREFVLAALAVSLLLLQVELADVQTSSGDTSEPHVDALEVETGTFLIGRDATSMSFGPGGRRITGRGVLAAGDSTLT
jgi:hypothetical protein